MRYVRRLLLAVIAAVLLLPVGASTAFAAVEGAPDLEALVVGGNEFQIGSTGELQIVLQNMGSFEGRVKGADDQVLAYGYGMSGMMVAYPCTTTQNLTLTLESSNPLIEIIGGSVYVGVLPRSYVTPQTLTFGVRVYKHADVGNYDLELKASYEYTEDVDWLNPPSSLPMPPDPYAYNPATYQPQFHFVHQERTETIPVAIKVTGSYFEVVEVEGESLRPGATGTVRLTLGNDGETAYEVTAEVLPSGNFVPVDRMSYLGTVDAGSRVTTEFKVAVSQDAIAKTSPLSIRISYRDMEDALRESTVKVGVETGGDIEFDIVTAELDEPLEPGAQRVLSVSVKNTSDTDLHDAVARVSTIDPFSSTDDTAYIGELPAGETRVARFEISADDDAMPKPYALDVDLKYKDANGNSYTSDAMKAEVRVVESDGFSAQTAILLAAAGIALGGGAYLVVRAVSRRRRLNAEAELSPS